MNYANQITEALKIGAINKILIVDDAFDVPEMEQRESGGLLEILKTETLRNYIGEELLSVADVKKAIEALEDGDLEEEAVTRAIEVLYSKYSENQIPSLDPNSYFNNKKGGALESLAPLLELLNSCSHGPEIKMVGTDERAKQICQDFKPDLVFMDFIISPDVEDGKKSTHLKNSTTFLKGIIPKEDTDNHPAVILMSSKEEVGARKNEYLEDLEGRVMSLHYGFLSKKWINHSEQGLIATDNAADVLMDISGSLQFGRSLEGAMKEWKIGTENALKDICNELREFDIKDFAYLLRFRIYNEGEKFADYLEWFLGESLKAVVDEKVVWQHEHFEKLNDRKLTNAIVGAHSTPSERLAKSFHRIRFNTRESRPRKRLALGDLFMASGKTDIRMVITPDCDLVPRDNKPSAIRFLTIGGEIKQLNNGAFADELILLDNPKAIKWNNKDLMTHKFAINQELNLVEVDGIEYKYFASMHPMYAQMVQKKTLAELSRVGMAVPPSVYVMAPVKVFLRKRNGNQERPVKLDLPEMEAQLFMPRDGNVKCILALFHQKFVRALFAEIKALQDNDLSPQNLINKKNFIQKEEEIRDRMLRDGVKLPSINIFKTLAGNKYTNQNKCWLEIAVDINNEGLIHFSGENTTNQGGGY